MASGKPSTWLPLGGLVEHSSLLYTKAVQSHDGLWRQVQWETYMNAILHMYGVYVTIYQNIYKLSKIMSHTKTVHHK